MAASVHFFMLCLKLFIFTAAAIEPHVSKNDIPEEFNQNFSKLKAKDINFSIYSELRTVLLLKII